MKIEVDMRGVGEPTQKMWEFIWKIEEALDIKYDGPEEFQAASDWISEHAGEFYLFITTSDDDYDDLGYEYYFPEY